MSNLYLTTTNNVKLFFTTASIGERILAYAVDLLIKFAYLIVIYFIFFQFYDVSKLYKNNEGVLIAVAALLTAPFIFYTLVSESLMNGQTFGKKLLKIKVIKIDGFQAGFFDYLTRWIFLVIDLQLAYLPGLISMLVAEHSQRLGDLAAGTAVISEKSKYDISHTILMDVEVEYQPYFAQNLVLLFSDNDMRIITESTQTALKQCNTKLLSRLVQKVESVMDIQNPFKSERELLETLHKDFNYFTGK